MRFFQEHCKVILTLFLMTIPFAGLAGIRDDRSSQIQLMATNFGNGVSLGMNFSDHIFVGAEYFSIELTGDGEDTANQEEYDADFANLQLNVRYYPFESSGFYAQAGYVQRNWKFVVTGTGEVGDSAQTADYKLTVEWPSTGANLGLGFNWMADFGLSGGLFLGAITGGKPTAKGEISNESGVINQNDVDKEVDEMYEREKLDERFSTIPLIAFYLGFNF